MQNKDIIKLNIADKISRWSYLSETQTFLEEDIDADIFLKAAKNLGWKIILKKRYVDSTEIRDYPHFDKNNIQEFDDLDIIATFIHFQIKQFLVMDILLSMQIR